MPLLDYQKSDRHGFTLWVSKNGNDANGQAAVTEFAPGRWSGDLEVPFLTIQAAVDEIVARGTNGTVIVNPGFYDESVTMASQVQVYELPGVFRTATNPAGGGFYCYTDEGTGGVDRFFVLGYGFYTAGATGAFAMKEGSIGVFQALRVERSSGAVDEGAVIAENNSGIFADVLAGMEGTDLLVSANESSVRYTGGSLETNDDPNYINASTIYVRGQSDLDAAVDGKIVNKAVSATITANALRIRGGGCDVTLKADGIESERDFNGGTGGGSAILFQYNDFPPVNAPTRLDLEVVGDVRCPLSPNIYKFGLNLAPIIVDLRGGTFVMESTSLQPNIGIFGPAGNPAKFRIKNNVTLANFGGNANTITSNNVLNNDIKAQSVIGVNKPPSVNVNLTFGFLLIGPVE